MTKEPLCQPLSKVKHDLNLLPKQFEANPLPVLVEQYGKPVFAIVPMETYLVMEGAMDYIQESDLGQEFEEWLVEEGMIQDSDNNAESMPETSTELLKSEGFWEDPIVRQAMREQCLKTLSELDTFEASL